MTRRLWESFEIDYEEVAVEGGDPALEIGPHVCVTRCPATRRRNIGQHNHAYRQCFVSGAREMLAKQLLVGGFRVVARQSVLVTQHAPGGPVEVREGATQHHCTIARHRRKSAGAVSGRCAELSICIGEADRFHRAISRMFHSR